MRESEGAQFCRLVYSHVTPGLALMSRHMSLLSKDLFTVFRPTQSGIRGFIYKIFNWAKVKAEDMILLQHLCECKTSRLGTIPSWKVEKWGGCRNRCSIGRLNVCSLSIKELNKKRENETNVIKILTEQIVFLSVSQGAFQILFCGFFPLREITSVESVFRKEEDGSTIQFRKKNR